MQLNNQRGQSLIEYLIIVALMGVASLSVVRLLNHTVSAQFADVINALQGKAKRIETESIKEYHYKKKDLSDFMNGAAHKKSK